MKTSFYLTIATLLLILLPFLYFATNSIDHVIQSKNPESVITRESLTNIDSIIMKTENQKFHPNDFSVNKEDYLKWRSVRFGKDNPEIVTSNYHRWLIESREPAFLIKRHFGDNIFKANPDPIWCFDRFGQSETTDSAGNTYLIGGEHEDYGCNDFCIYNDVVRIGADSSVTLFLYPENVFPPTDFHSATLIGSEIFIIGTIGYVQTRKDGTTNVFRLSLHDMSISKYETTGENPGWIFCHIAKYDKESNEIIVYDGERCHPEENIILNNFDVYGLNVKDGKWRLIQKTRVETWHFKLKSDSQSFSLSDLYSYSQEQSFMEEEEKKKSFEWNDEFLRKQYEENKTYQDAFPNYEEFEELMKQNQPKNDLKMIFGFQPNFEYLDELFDFPVHHKIIQGLLYGGFGLGKYYVIEINESTVAINTQDNTFSFLGNFDRNVIEGTISHFRETLIKIGYDDIVFEKVK